MHIEDNAVRPCLSWLKTMAREAISNNPRPDTADTLLVRTVLPTGTNDVASSRVSEIVTCYVPLFDEPIIHSDGLCWLQICDM